jgi:DNA uptake protein ComE-like DNA-binding protein
MRLKPAFLAVLLGLSMAAPAFAQTAAPAAPTAPAVAKPAKPVKPASSAKAPLGPVNVNTATAAELDKLPGIGKARSAAIIKGRPYKSADEIDTRKVIPHSTYEKIKAQLTI